MFGRILLYKKNELYLFTLLPELLFSLYVLIPSRVILKSIMMAWPYTSGLYASRPLLRRVIDTSAELRRQSKKPLIFLEYVCWQKLEAGFVQRILCKPLRPLRPHNYSQKENVEKKQKLHEVCQFLPFPFLHKTLQRWTSVCRLRIPT